MKWLNQHIFMIINDIHSMLKWIANWVLDKAKRVCGAGLQTFVSVFKRCHLGSSSNQKSLVHVTTNTHQYKWHDLNELLIQNKEEIKY